MRLSLQIAQGLVNWSILHLQTPIEPWNGLEFSLMFNSGNSHFVTERMDIGIVRIADYKYINR